ncbi:MAG: MBL fold metallo-hydrolase [Cyclobacteriaceae bacterium]|nr:MBL fold metallo-hydrolase [Cyclobacteriaceae bacterium]
MTGIVILGAVLLLIIVGYLFIKLSPQFGGKPTQAQIEIFKSSNHYKDGIFVNEMTTSMDMNFSKSMSILKDYIVGVPHNTPSKHLPVQHIDSLDIVNRPDTVTRITWFGHSAFLLEIQGKNILIDPMFGDTPSPHPWLGRSRFTEGLPIAIEKLPEIDAVIFSHDHYDHLDYGSILKLKGKVKNFYTPLGVGSHLEKWGVPKENIHELNWWEEIKFEDLTFKCAPARHFSGRGLGDRFSTLWASWVIQGANHNIYFSGDSGYGPHFKTIGEKYGPFDFAMMECGQYDKRWDNIHMMPEETAQAAVDVNTKLFMPIHWGAFVLALHTWKDPIERVTKKAEELSIPISTPQIGEPIILELVEKPHSKWWEGIE